MVTAAFRQSKELGRAYAERGHSAAQLLQVYLRLRQHMRRVLPAQVHGDELWMLERPEAPCNRR